MREGAARVWSCLRTVRRRRRRRSRHSSLIRRQLSCSASLRDQATSLPSSVLFHTVVLAQLCLDSSMTLLRCSGALLCPHPSCQPPCSAPSCRHQHHHGEHWRIEQDQRTYWPHYTMQSLFTSQDIGLDEEAHEEERYHKAGCD